MKNIIIIIVAMFGLVANAIAQGGCESCSQPPTPVITWATPAPITFGTALSTTQLDATASYNGVTLTGTFVYSPAAGTTPAAGTDTLSVTFYPAQSGSYLTATQYAYLKVTTPPIVTTPVVTSSINPSAFGVPVLYTATISAADGSVPTGNVEFMDGSTIIGAAVLHSGTGSVITSTLIPTTHNIMAAYLGDGTHASSSAAMIHSQVVQNTPPVTTVILSPATALSGQEITALVSVTSAPSMQPNGSISCSASGISTVTQSLGANGQASLELESLPLGSDVVSCTFTSSTNSNTSTGTATATIIAAGSVATGGMMSSKFLQIAGALPNGNILVAGGGESTSGIAPAKDAEIYSPSLGTFSEANQMNVARESAAYVVLQDGEILVTGGITGSSNESSAEYYDPSTSQFVSVGDMTTNRSSHTATLLQNGQVLIAGGLNSTGIVSSAELYDPLTATFTATGSMSYTRAEFSAVLLSTGNILVVGGTDDNSQGNTVGLNKAELYNPSTGTFSAAANMPFGAENLTATTLPDGTVLIAGGDSGNSTTPTASAAIYDPTANTFTSVGSLITARTGHTATLLGNGLVLIAGGYTHGGYSTPTNSLELYDPSSKTFSSAGTMSSARADQTATLLSNSVLIAGGIGSSGGPLEAAELYNFSEPEGIVDLKYLVVGITYAPPGSGSTVTYGQSSTLTSSTSISNMIGSGVKMTVSQKAGVGLQVGSSDSFNDNITTTESAAYNTSSNSTTMSVTANTSGTSIITAGPTSSSIGVDHDYDVIYIWLDPQVDITFPQLAYPTVNWAGLSYQGCDAAHTSNCDPNNFGNPDIVGIPVLCLKNPYLAPSCTQWLAYTSRSWDKTGNGALNLADYQAILGKDPFINSPIYNPANDSSGSISEATGSIQYPIPSPGQSPGTYTGTSSTTTTGTTTQVDTRQYETSFEIDDQISGGFLADFGDRITTTVNNTWTETDSTSSALASTSTASYFVKGPAVTDDYTGQPVFDVWHDNYYGSFLFFSPDQAAITPASITSSSSAIDFSGTVTVGSVSSPQTITFTNNSSVPMTMSTTSFAPLSTAVTFSTGSFSVISDECSGILLQAQGTCAVSVHFSPLATDLNPSGTTVVNGTMIVSGVENAAGSTNVLITAQIPMSGTGEN